MNGGSIHLHKGLCCDMKVEHNLITAPPSDKPDSTRLNIYEQECHGAP